MLIFKVDINRKFIREFISAATFSFIKVPAFLLFIFVVTCYFKGSLSAGVISEGRHLTEGAPAGMVNSCKYDYPLKTAPTISEPPELIGAAPDLPESCQPALEKASDYAKNADKRIASMYLVIALFSVFLWGAFKKYVK